MRRMELAAAGFGAAVSLVRWDRGWRRGGDFFTNTRQMRVAADRGSVELGLLGVFRVSEGIHRVAMWPV